MDDWRQRFEAEIRRGEQARAEGNEGMSRVCARRAAGVVVDEYLRRQGRSEAGRISIDSRPPRASAYDNLRRLASLPGIPADVLESADHLLSRITPEGSLPVEADLIAEAWRLRERLLEE